MADSARTVGGIVARRRRHLGLSQAGLAQRLGRSESWVSQVERGVRQVDRLSALRALSDALDLPVATWLDPDGAASAEAGPGGAGLAPLPEAPGGFGTVLADPPWRFENRTGKASPEHRRLRRYPTLSLAEIAGVPVGGRAAGRAHLYLWVPNALLPDGLAVMRAWGFRYVTNLVWAKRRQDGAPDGSGVGFYFRNATELLLFGVRGPLRTLGPARSQVNIIDAAKRGHSAKPEEQYAIIEACSPGPRLELFARRRRAGWAAWGDEAGTAGNLDEN